MGREAICLLFFPLLLRLAFAFPGIVVGTQGFETFVCCVVEPVLFLLSIPGDVHFLCCTIKAFEKSPSTSQIDWEQQGQYGRWGAWFLGARARAPLQIQKVLWTYIHLSAITWGLKGMTYRRTSISGKIKAKITFPLRYFFPGPG
jgi:hypothetical protein